MQRVELWQNPAMRRACFAALAAVSLALPARAVIVAGGDGSQNTTAVGAGAGWAYVGAVNGASGVYLGDYDGHRWVLTAGHVGAGAFTLEGQTFGVVDGSAVTLTVSPGVTTDLTMFRIDGDPARPPLALAATTPVIGSAVTMIGSGVNREADLTRWNLFWAETSGLGVHSGYKWADGNPKRWGANTVSGYGTYANATALTKTFQNTNGSAQATVGDSGGGVFAADGSLVGIMVAVTSAGGQPVATSVFGNQTFSLDVASVRPEILAVIGSVPPVPEPAAFALLAAAALAGLGRSLIRTGRADPR